MSRSNSDERMALPPIRQAIPEILEAIPGDHDRSMSYNPLPTPPQSRPPTQSSSYAIASISSAYSNDHARSLTRQLWDSDVRDSRPRQGSLTSLPPTHHSPSVASGSTASCDYHGGLGYGENSREASYRSQQSYHHGDNPRPAMLTPDSIEAQQLSCHPHHGSTSTEGSLTYTSRPHMKSTGSSESRPPSEPISPDFASPAYYDEQDGSQYSNPSHQGQANQYTEYPYPVRPLHIISDFESQKNKRRRGNLPKRVTDLLRRWYSEHRLHPYPTEDEKQQLMTDTGLSIAQISNWFINARRRQPRSNSTASSPHTNPD